MFIAYFSFEIQNQFPFLILLLVLFVFYKVALSP